MHRNSMLAAAAGLAFSLGPTAADAATTVVLNFDDLTGTGLVPTEYGGVVFGDDFSHYDTPATGFPPASGLTTVYANYQKHRPGLEAALSFRFNQPVRFDGAFFAGKLHVAYDFYREGAKVGSAGHFTLGDQAAYYASGYDGLIDEVRLSGNTGNWVMDDLTYTTGLTTAVPEPTTWALMILGFGGAGAALRSRRRAFA